MTTAMVEHWTRVLAAGRVAPDPTSTQGKAQRRHALEYLIASAWLTGEAVSQGVSISGEEVKHRLVEKEQTSFPGGEGEFHDFLKATGQTVADVELEAKTELASARLRQLATVNAVRVTDAQIASYYERHKQQFSVPERREAQITNQKTRAAAERIKRAVESGGSLLSAAQRKVGEGVVGAGAVPGQRDTVERVIMAARPNVPTGPVEIGGDYYLFKVTKIVPARTRTLAQSERAIRRQLAAEQERRALAAFVEAWRTKWTAKTDCQPGYVAQKCRQYVGAKAPEDPLTLN